MNRFEDIVYLHCYDVILDFAGEMFDHLIVVIPCNDVFSYASADAEDIPPGREHEVRKLYEQYGWPGVIAWCAKERGQEPLPAYLKILGEDEYRAVRKSQEAK